MSCIPLSLSSTLYETFERHLFSVPYPSLRVKLHLSLQSRLQREYTQKLELFLIFSFFYLSHIASPKFYNMILSTGLGKKEQVHKTFLKLKFFSSGTGSIFRFEFQRYFLILNLLKTVFVKPEHKYLIAAFRKLDRSTTSVKLLKFLNMPLQLSNRGGKLLYDSFSVFVSSSVLAPNSNYFKI